MNDFLTDESGNLIIENGDFKVGDAKDQDVRAILTATKATYVQYPLLGVGLVNQVNGFIDQSVKREIRLNLAADGYRVSGLTYINGKLDLYARKNNS